MTNAGHLKILDFGIAKRLETQDSARRDPGLTEPGTVLGTAGYMSPEQVKAAPVDHRSDLFSFGAVLYEMLSGQHAFARSTAIETMTAILHDEPPDPADSGRPITPALDHVVRHCLEKNPSHRFQSAKDVVFALSEASHSDRSGPRAVAQEPAPVPKRRRRVRGTTLAWSAIALAAVVGAGLLVWPRRPRQASAPVVPSVTRLAVLPFENLGAAEDEYFADGIADEVRGKLDAPAGPAGDRPRKLDAVPQDDQDAAGDRRRARRAIPADRHRALGQGRRRAGACT